MLLRMVKNLNDIRFAEKLLDWFSWSFNILYGEMYNTLTIHQLTNHLVNDVKLHGSLIGHSLYSMEGVMGYCKNRLNGTRGFENQFVNSMFC